jgi:hypothetical protein
LATRDRDQLRIKFKQIPGVSCKKTGGAMTIPETFSQVKIGLCLFKGDQVNINGTDNSVRDFGVTSSIFTELSDSGKLSLL